MTATTEKLEFRTELKQLLHLITHSLYSNKEIFLRELISNASDAINKIKFDSLQHEELLEDNKDWKIKIAIDKDKGTLTVSDNGIGLSRETAVENLGTIARSGTRAFLESLKQASVQNRPELIGQFGVGFYSSFMVADKVTVLSRPAGDPKGGVRWESDGQGEFTVEPFEKPARGTDVILHLKADEKDFLEPYHVRQIVKKFSDFIEHPVVMAGEKGDETLNSQKAMWLRSKADVTPEEYTEFYKQIAGDFTEPAKVIHYGAEGQIEFKALLFVPAHRPMEFQWGEVKVGPKLYIQRVLIMDHCEALMPLYLRFIKGVVDAADLPLNISRELLQQNPMLERIQRNLIKTVLRGLEEMKSDEYEKYVAFFRELGDILKEGPGRERDKETRDKLTDLLLFGSLKTEKDKYLTLAQYVEAMPADQKEIAYLIGESRGLLENSPYLESFRAKGWDVLLLTDPVDEYLMGSLSEYKGKRFQAADRGAPTSDKPDAGKFKALFEHLQKQLEEVKEVRLSSRLKESAACLVADEHAPSAHMERLLERMGRAGESMRSKRVLELNGEHPAVLAMLGVFAKDAADPRIDSYARLLYDQAVLAEGSKVQDPAALARRINELIAKDAH